MTFSIQQFRLDGKVAIVTGAGGRPNSIGEAYCKGLAAAGASVVAADLSGKGAAEVAARITAGGSKAIAVEVDITRPESVQAMVEAASRAFGGVDILVNNAALMVELREKTCDISLEGWNRAIAVNLTGAFLCSRAVVPSMKARGGGRIVNQVSGGAYPARGVYGITKLALVGLTTALAGELGKDKIAVNAIAPGMTGSDAGNSLTGPGSAFRTLMEATSVMRAQGATDDLVGPLLLLCSPAGDWITGQVLHVDGGWILRP